MVAGASILALGPHGAQDNTIHMNQWRTLRAVPHASPSCAPLLSLGLVWFSLGWYLQPYPLSHLHQARIIRSNYSLYKEALALTDAQEAEAEAARQLAAGEQGRQQRHEAWQQGQQGQGGAAGAGGAASLVASTSQGAGAEAVAKREADLRARLLRSQVRGTGALRHREARIGTGKQRGRGMRLAMEPGTHLPQYRCCPHPASPPPLTALLVIHYSTSSFMDGNLNYPHSLHPRPPSLLK